MTLVFLLEERSMQAFLAGFLPRILPPGVEFKLIPHEGKQDLDRSIPRKLRAWRDPSARFIIVRDQDSDDCRRLKARLINLCERAGRPDTLIRIACRELEAWYLAELAALDVAYGTRVAHHQEQRKFRSPDNSGSPVVELRRLVPDFSKVDGARRLGLLLDPSNTRSTSFAQFVTGVQRLPLPGAASAT